MIGKILTNNNKKITGYPTIPKFKIVGALKNIKMELNQLQQDVIRILEESKDMVQLSDYRGDIPMEITSTYNCDGTFTYWTNGARKSLADYIDNYPDLLGDIVRYYQSDLDMEIGSGFFTNPECFQVQILIEVIRRVLYEHKDMSEWLYDDELVRDTDVYCELIDNVIEDIEAGELDFYNL